MKKLLLAVTLLSSFCFSCEIKWYNSIEAAKKESLKTKKPIMAFVSSTTCPYCTTMSESTFADSVVCSEVMRRFVPLIALEGGDDVPRNARIRGVPAILFVDASEKEVAPRVIGLRNKKDFLSDIEQRFKGR